MRTLPCEDRLVGALEDLDKQCLFTNVPAVPATEIGRMLCAANERGYIIHTRDSVVEGLVDIIFERV